MRGQYITWQATSLFTQTVLHDSRRRSNHCHSNLLWIGVPALYFNALPLTLGSHVLNLRKVLEMVSFSLQTCITHNKHVVHCMLKFCWQNGKKHCILNALLSDHLQCKDCYHTLHPLICLTSKHHMGSDLTNKEAAIPRLLFCHQKCSVKKACN